MKWFAKILIKLNKLLPELGAIRKMGEALGIFFLTLCCCAGNVPTLIPPYHTVLYDQEINFIYTYLFPSPSHLTERIILLSYYFLGRDYLLGALGEGPSSNIDHSPLYRTDAFDCMTYVSTVLALALSSDRQSFIETLKKIQYKNGQVAYINRYHFLEPDWNEANQHLGYVRDITREIFPRVQYAFVTLDRPEWFNHLPMETLKCFASPPSSAANHLLSLLHRHANKVRKTFVKTPYIPLTALFKLHKGRPIPNWTLFHQLPSVSIVEIVDQESHRKAMIGTDLTIVHMGFALQTQGGIRFLNASKIYHKVVDLPLVQYLQRYYEVSKDPEKVGVHVLAF